MIGVGLGGTFTLNDTVFDAMVPLATLICAVPGNTIVIRSIAAVNCVLLTKVVCGAFRATAVSPVPLIVAALIV
jgi:hypothetical protein